MIYIIDGSLEGLLSAVFEWFERKPGKILLRHKTIYQPDAFAPSLHIHSNYKKADRVWRGLQERLSAEWMRKFYCTFLSELPEANYSLFEFACYVFSNAEGAENNYGNAHVLKLSQIATMVEREKHRMEAFVRFQHTAEGIFYCCIDPDFNVLPLIKNHFKNRYADQQWLIYDVRRHYGIYYDLEKVEEISFSPADEKKLWRPEAGKLSVQEDLYVTLWKNYFKSANIAARKNSKLHVRHVPKRYWKYLSEIC